MTTGEGGMVTTNDAALAEKIRVLGLHGLSADAWNRFSDAGYRHYDVVWPGFKYNLTDIAASLGLSQLPRLGGWLKRREELWHRYDQAFADLPLRTPAVPAPDTLHARHLYTILLDAKAPLSRDAFMAEMHRRQIGTGVHYRALHVHPYYRDRWRFRPEQFPNALAIGQSTVSLPLMPKLTDEDAGRVIEAVRALLG
jgi:dTDP-4-amino-4,6-dideoxygalactose transaminase